MAYISLNEIVINDLSGGVLTFFSMSILLVFLLVFLSVYLGKDWTIKKKRTVLTFIAIALVAFVIIPCSLRSASFAKADMESYHQKTFEQVKVCVDEFLLGEDIWLSDEKLSLITEDIIERGDYECDKKTGCHVSESYLKTLLIILEPSEGSQGDTEKSILLK